MRLPLIVVVLLMACTADEEQARKVLEAYGFEQITFGGYPFYRCGKDDEFNIEFSAINVKKQPVSGAVCCGLWKSCTVRLR